jgi:hypothetical protein
MVLNLDLNVKHTGPTAVVVITSNLNEAADNVSILYYFRNLGHLEISLSLPIDVQKVAQLVKLMINPNNVITGNLLPAVGLL